MKAKPMKRSAGGLVPCPAAEATHVILHCPGPYENRLIPVHSPGSSVQRAGPVWDWNRDTERLTLKPSILTTGDQDMPRCHSFVRNGQIQFLSDCDHELAGQTVDLLDVEP